MKFLDEIISKNEKRVPKKTDESDKHFVDWNDFNFPSFYPLVHYNPTEVEDKDKQSFVSVSLIDVNVCFDYDCCLLSGVYNHCHLRFSE